MYGPLEDCKCQFSFYFRKKRGNRSNNSESFGFEVQLSGGFATLSSTHWVEKAEVAPLAGRDHSYLILNICILIYFHT